MLGRLSPGYVLTLWFLYRFNSLFVGIAQLVEQLI
jgi:hypothetical protein